MLAGRCAPSTMRQQTRKCQPSQPCQAGFEQVAAGQQDQPLTLLRVAPGKGMLMTMSGVGFAHEGTPRREVRMAVVNTGYPNRQGSGSQPECEETVNRWVERRVCRDLLDQVAHDRPSFGSTSTFGKTSLHERRGQTRPDKGGRHLCDGIDGVAFHDLSTLPSDIIHGSTQELDTHPFLALVFTDEKARDRPDWYFVDRFQDT